MARGAWEGGRPREGASRGQRPRDGPPRGTGDVPEPPALRVRTPAQRVRFGLAVAVATRACRVVRRRCHGGILAAAAARSGAGVAARRPPPGGSRQQDWRCDSRSALPYKGRPRQAPGMPVRPSEPAQQPPAHPSIQHASNPPLPPSIPTTPRSAIFPHPPS